MNCENSLNTCKAFCCTCYVTFSDEIIHKYKDNIDVNYVNHNGFLITENQKCVFLSNNKCKIYDDRPDFCRDFGSEKNLALTCSYQNKDGIIRKRQERRRIQRQFTKTVEKYINGVK